MDDKLTLNTVVKTFQMLEFIIDSKEKHTLTSLSKALKMSIGGTQRITSTLIQLGYLRREPESKTFHLDAKKWLHIGFSLMNEMDLRKIAIPFLKKLNAETNETVSLGILDGDAVIIIERIISDNLITTNIRPGVRRPLHQNSIGKLLLAFQDKSKIDQIVDNIDQAKSIDNIELYKEKIKIELKTIKKNLFAINDDKEVFAIATPVFNTPNNAIAGINIVIPKYRYDKNKIYKNFLPKMKKICEMISDEIGKSPDPVP